jgi:hypothetical protein
MWFHERVMVAIERATSVDDPSFPEDPDRRDGLLHSARFLLQERRSVFRQSRFWLFSVPEAFSMKALAQTGSLKNAEEPSSRNGERRYVPVLDSSLPATQPSVFNHVITNETD